MRTAIPFLLFDETGGEAPRCSSCTKAALSLGVGWDSGRLELDSVERYAFDGTTGRRKK